MPPRLRLRLRPSQFLVSPAYTPALQRCAFASVAAATTPAPAIDTVVHAPATIHRHANTQPPSYKPPEFRKSQLHRQYTSLLRSSPLILVFQHNNIKANEWMAIRRELTHALRKVDEDIQKANPEGELVSYADAIKIQIVQTGIFGAALKIVEFYKPEGAEATEMSHGLSKAAYVAANSKNLKHELDPLMSGPLAILSFPAVSPQHLKAALSILSPSPEFPAPKRRARPAYHDPAVQGGLQKLMLLASRVEGKVFDQAGIKWIGGIDGGLDGLRAQLVHMLQSLGASVTNTLEGASKSLYFTMESRKGQLEEEQTPTEKSS